MLEITCLFIRLSILRYFSGGLRREIQHRQNHFPVGHKLVNRHKNKNPPNLLTKHLSAESNSQHAAIIINKLFPADKAIRKKY